MEKLIIELKDIAAGYDQKKVFDNVNLKISDHDFLGIIGPNGGGKTTLIKLILGLLKPQKGTIHFYQNGEPVNKLNMGYLPQSNAIDKKFPISVKEVISSGIRNDKLWSLHYSAKEKERITAVVARMGLEGLENKSIGQLSGGQMQRALLGRAIVSNPHVIILDEPSTYVDKRFEESLYCLLNEINAECCIILVSHDLQSVLSHSQNIACVNHAFSYHTGNNVSKEWITNNFE